MALAKIWARPHRERIVPWQTLASSPRAEARGRQQDYHGHWRHGEEHDRCRRIGCEGVEQQEGGYPDRLQNDGAAHSEYRNHGQPVSDAKRERILDRSWTQGREGDRA